MDYELQVAICSDCASARSFTLRRMHWLRRTRRAVYDPDPTVTATPAPTTSGSLTPGPTQTVPPGKEVEFELTGGFPSRVTNDLYIKFIGGKGWDYVKSIDIHVTKSNGEVITEAMEPTPNKELIIHNAKGDNRVAITVSLITGGTYTVIDEIVEVP